MFYFDQFPIYVTECSETPPRQLFKASIYLIIFFRTES